MGQSQQAKRKHAKSNEETIAPRDPLLAYKKPQLVSRLRTAQQQVLEMQRQLAISADASMKQEAHITELEAKLATLEPYRSFVEQMRAQMLREEQGRFGDLPPNFENLPL